jgi:hypothetical protein
MQLMPDVGYVKFYHNLKEGLMYAVECDKFDNDNAPWRANCSSREIRGKRVKWTRFYEFICDNMNWIIGNEYTIPAVFQEIEGERLIFFDLNERKEKSLFFDIKLSDMQDIE